eukprot:6173222-Pleurochrysis_carterae.AAC.1
MATQKCKYSCTVHSDYGHVSPLTDTNILPKYDGTTSCVPTIKKAARSGHMSQIRRSWNHNMA